MPTYTTPYNLAKPLVNDASDQDLWGGELNDNMDIINDALVTGNYWLKRVVTGTDTATTADQNKMILGNATGGAYDQTLPDASTAGDGFAIVCLKTDASANAITVKAQGSDTVLGAASVTLTSQNQSYALVSDGVSNWNPFAFDTIPAASDTVAGKIEIATAAEVKTGTSTTLAVTPGRMSNFYGVAKGVVTFSGAGTISASKGDIVSVVRNSSGTYTVTVAGTYTTLYPAVTMSPNDASRTNGATVNAFMASVTTITVQAQKQASGPYDPTEITLVVFAE